MGSMTGRSREQLYWAFDPPDAPRVVEACLGRAVARGDGSERIRAWGWTAPGAAQAVAELGPIEITAHLPDDLRRACIAFRWTVYLLTQADRGRVYILDVENVRSYRDH